MCRLCCVCCFGLGWVGWWLVVGGVGGWVGSVPVPDRRRMSTRAADIALELNRRRDRLYLFPPLVFLCHVFPAFEPELLITIPYVSVGLSSLPTLTVAPSSGLARPGHLGAGTGRACTPESLERPLRGASHLRSDDVVLVREQWIASYDGREHRWEAA